MITVPEVVKTIVSRSPYIGEALEKNILNLSGLAREIHQEVEERSMKEVQIGSIVMALKRMQPQLQDKNRSRTISEPEIIVRSNLFEITVKNSELMTAVQKDLLQLASERTTQFTTITHGVFETTIIAGHDVKEAVYSHIPPASIVSEISELSSITIKFAESIIHTPGVYSHVLKQLAWQGISLTEIVSTYSELTIIVKNEVVSDAFSSISRIYRIK